MDTNINLFFAVSKKFVQHFTVSLTSLLENNKDLGFNVFIIHDEPNLEVFSIAAGYFKSTYNTSLQFLSIGNIDFSKFRTTSHYPKHTYFRLFLAEVAPSYVDKALFIDSDVVVTSSIRDLVEIDVSGNYLYAVSEASVDDNVQRLNALGFPATRYFNAGIILINVKAWRDEKLSEAFINIANTHGDRLEWVDQDILNIYFAKNWVELNRTFNATHLTKELPYIPTIIHFASYSKPWYYADTHPYNYLYWIYLRLTPYKESKAVGFSFKNFIFKNGKLIKRYLRKAGILND